MTVTHGLTGYKKHHCHCLVCRAAWAATMRRYRQKRNNGGVYVGPKSIGRPGLVTVFDSDGYYLGCMGLETWRWLLVRDLDERDLTAMETAAGLPPWPLALARADAPQEQTP